MDLEKDKEAVERLLKENEEFRTAYDAHKEYTRKVDKMEKKAVLTNAEEVEKKRLKKLKLAMRDKMENILGGHAK